MTTVRESKLRNDVSSALGRVTVFKGVDELKTVPHTGHRHSTHFETVKRLLKGDGSFKAKEPKVVFFHGERVINSNENLVVTFGREGAPKPYLVITIVTCDKRNDFLHVKPFTSLEVTLKVL